MEEIKFPPFKKALQRYIGFLKNYRNYITRLAEKIKPFFQLLKTTENKNKIIVATELMNEFCVIFDVLDKCCQLAVRQLLQDKQIILITDANLKAARYAALTEDDPNQFFMSTH